MDAVQVMGGCIGNLHAVLFGELRVAVALGTGLGEVELKDRRLMVGDGLDLVSAVAVGAGGGGTPTQVVAYTVDTAAVFLGGRFVTVSALGRG